MQKPILTLELSPQPKTRSVVAIAGRHYPLRLPEQLTIPQLRRLERICPRGGQLVAQEALTNAEGAELSAILEEVCGIALEAPAAILKQLGEVNRARVFAVYAEVLSGALTAGGQRRRPSGGRARKRR